jgi:hypothetical protein
VTVPSYDFILATLDGSVTIVLPPPGPDIDRTLVKIGGIQTTLAGNDIQHTVATKRSYTLSWEELPSTQWAQIEDFYAGAYGPGPYTFTWPGYAPVLVNLVDLPESSPKAAPDGGTLHTGSLVMREVTL